MKGGKSRKPVAGTILELIREVGDAAVKRVMKEHGGSKPGRMAAAEKINQGGRTWTHNRCTMKQ